MFSMKIIAGIKGTYYTLLSAFTMDDSDAFQSTPSLDADGKLPKLYCRQPPGFEKKGANGERLVCEVLVGMQGRIDATRLYANR